MSGIYISNMKMPANCSDCPMCYDMMECVIGNPYISFYRKEMKEEPFDFCNERHPRCPLIPVPEHGRLIDADALIDKVIAKYLKFEREGKLVFAAAEIKQDICDLISDAPTIIQQNTIGYEWRML